MVLTDVQREACAAIVAAPEAWIKKVDLEAVYGGEVLKDLLALEFVATWKRPDYEGVTLTPWGAWHQEVEVDEEWKPAFEVREERDELNPLAPPIIRKERVMVETPVWVDRGTASKQVTIPKYGRIGAALADPARVEEPELVQEDEYLLREDGEPVELFVSPLDGKGVKVLVRRRRRKKALAAAKTHKSAGVCVPKRKQPK